MVGMAYPPPGPLPCKDQDSCRPASVAATDLLDLSATAALHSCPSPTEGRDSYILATRIGPIGCRYIFASVTLGVMPSPLREPTFLILTALAREPLHGYAIITEVASLSEGQMTLRPGTLYGALDRLSDDGLVTVDREEVVEGRLRRYYWLTNEGAEVLRTETERMQRNVEAATRRLHARDRVARTAAGRAITPAVRPAGGVA